MLSKKTINKEEKLNNTRARNKPKRMWAGKVRILNELTCIGP